MKKEDVIRWLEKQLKEAPTHNEKCCYIKVIAKLKELK